MGDHSQGSQALRCTHDKPPRALRIDYARIQDCPGSTKCGLDACGSGAVAGDGKRFESRHAPHHRCGQGCSRRACCTRRNKSPTLSTEQTQALSRSAVAHTSGVRKCARACGYDVKGWRIVPCSQPMDQTTICENVVSGVAVQHQPRS